MFRSSRFIRSLPRKREPRAERVAFAGLGPRFRSRTGFYPTSADERNLHLGRRAAISHRRRHSTPADAPCAAFQRSIGLLGRDNEDLRASLKIIFVPLRVSNNGGIGGNRDFLFSILVFQRQRWALNRGD